MHIRILHIFHEIKSIIGKLYIIFSLQLLGIIVSKSYFRNNKNKLIDCKLKQLNELWMGIDIISNIAIVIWILTSFQCSWTFIYLSAVIWILNCFLSGWTFVNLSAVIWILNGSYSSWTFFYLSTVIWILRCFMINYFCDISN